MAPRVRARSRRLRQRSAADAAAQPAGAGAVHDAVAAGGAVRVGLPEAAARRCWCSRWRWGSCARSGARLTASAMALVVAGWWLPVILDMQEGQTNFLALLPLVAGVVCRAGGQPRSDAIAGLLIGLAIAVKVTPVVFAAYFFWKRRWVVAASALAGVAYLVAGRAGRGLRLGSESAVARAVGRHHDRALRHARHGGVRDEPVVRQLRAAAVLGAVPVFETPPRRLAELRYMNLLALEPDRGVSARARGHGRRGGRRTGLDAAPARRRCGARAICSRSAPSRRSCCGSPSAPGCITTSASS